MFRIQMCNRLNYYLQFLINTELDLLLQIKLEISFYLLLRWADKLTAHLVISGYGRWKRTTKIGRVAILIRASSQGALKHWC